jgi:hypothetical protein
MSRAILSSGSVSLVFAVSLAACGDSAKPTETRPSETRPAPDTKNRAPVDRAIEARGGRSRLLGMATAHIKGTMKFPGGESAELEAYVDRKGAADRALIQFRSGAAFRALGLLGNMGFERDESGTYRRVEGAAFEELRMNAVALLLASRFPLDGVWDVAGATLRRRDDAVEVEVGPDGLPARFRFPSGTAAGAACRVSDWKPEQDVLFPMTLDFTLGSAPAWTLRVETWDPQAVVVDSLFEPPQAQGATTRPESTSRSK